MFGALPASSGAQVQAPPLFYPAVGFDVAVGFSRTTLDPNPPRNLRNHENGASYLSGFAGETDLARIHIDAARVQLGITRRVGDRNIALLAGYAPEFPLVTSGRLERQQVNDTRAAGNASFIYTKLQSVGVGHIVLAGMAFALPVTQRQDWWLETQGLVGVGRWDMTFEKGWSRSSNDDIAIRSRAAGLDLSPRVTVTLRTSSVGFDVGVAWRRIRFRHAAYNLEDHIADGFSVMLGGRAGIPFGSKRFVSTTTPRRSKLDSGA